VTISRGAVFRLVDKLIWIVVGLVTAVVIEGVIKR